MKSRPDLAAWLVAGLCVIASATLSGVGAPVPEFIIAIGLTAAGVAGGVAVPQLLHPTTDQTAAPAAVAPPTPPTAAAKVPSPYVQPVAAQGLPVGPGTVS